MQTPLPEIETIEPAEVPEPLLVIAEAQEVVVPMAPRLPLEVVEVTIEAVRHLEVTHRAVEVTIVLPADLAQEVTAAAVLQEVADLVATEVQEAALEAQV